VNNRLCILSSFFRFAQSYGVKAPDGKTYPLLRTLSPTSGIRYAPKGRPPYKSLDENELAAFFKAIGPAYDSQGTPDLLAMRDRALFLFFFWTARRRSEILELRIGDLEQSVIVDGDVKRDAVLYHFRGKGKKALADLSECPPQAAEALYLWLAESGALESPKADDAIFTSLRTDPRFNRKRPLAPQTCWSLTKKYATLAGIPHSFRHAAARARWQATGDLEAVRQTLRHQNIATTHLYIRGLNGIADHSAALLVGKFGDL
jgi:integrase/recombinase XerD